VRSFHAYHHRVTQPCSARRCQPSRPCRHFQPHRHLGGATKAAQQAAYFQPFEQSGAGKVVAGEYNGELSKVKAMVDVGHVSWDVVEVESPELIRGCEAGLFERIDPALLGDQANYLPGTVSECGVASYVWSMVLAYNTQKLANGPTSWADFGTPSASRASAGCARAPSTPSRSRCWPMAFHARTCTPCWARRRVNRAFKKLDQIKQNIQWWEAGAQPPQWLVAGDVVMSAAYNGRIASAQKDGSKLGIVWQGSLYDPTTGPSCAAPRARNWRSSSSPSQPGRHAENLLQPHPLRPGADRCGQCIAGRHPAALPTAPGNLAEAQLVNAEFWVDHGEELEERINAWAAR
jgi:putative spermidine/putrescine transport system substrate-binding protein